MASDHTAAAEASAEKADIRFGQSGIDALFAQIAVENQSGTSGRRTDALVVHLEICDSRDSDSSQEPVLELSFPVKPIKGIVVHQGELGEDAQKLALGGQISKTAEKIEMELANDDKIALNTKTGDVNIDSQDRYQKEVHFEGSPWQRTVLTSDHDTRITVGPQGLSSIEQGGMMELFPKAYSQHVGAEPRLPASEELDDKLDEKGRSDLKKELSKIDRAEDSAQAAFLKSNGDKTSVKALSETIKERGLFLEKAAQVLPVDSVELEASAENQLRIALRNMRDLYGAGTPETKTYAEALQGLLKKEGNCDQQDEIDRLAFEAKRGGLMKDVVESIEKSPGATWQTMAQPRAQTVRRSLISVHIAGGDNALKSFVSDVNQRLDSQALVAPLGQDGPFHHGAIILTPEGATTYNGSFNLEPKSKH